VVLDGRKKVIDRFQCQPHIAPMSGNCDMDIEANGEKLLRVKEAAAKLTVKPRTVWRMIAAGELKVVHIRRCTRVYLSSVKDYLKKQNQAVCV
jgi:excisionase family DNA binding protein